MLFPYCSFTSAVLLSHYMHSLELFLLPFVQLPVLIHMHDCICTNTQCDFFFVQFLLIYVRMRSVSLATAARCTGLVMWPTVILTARDLTPVPQDKTVLWRKCSVSQPHAREDSPVKVHIHCDQPKNEWSTFLYVS